MESLASYRIISLDCPANSDSLYWQGYPKCHFGIYQDIILSTWRWIQHVFLKHHFLQKIMHGIKMHKAIIWGYEYYALCVHLLLCACILNWRRSRVREVL
jgi:hypothetical protein